MSTNNNYEAGECYDQKVGVIHLYVQLKFPDNIRAIKGLVVYNSWDLEPLDLLNGLALSCYHPLKMF